MDPEEREWFWWDGTTTGPAQIRITVQVEGRPFPTGALRWLLTSASGTSVELP